MNDKVSILIVDDRPEKVLALEAVLEDLQQEIVRAYSGREALRHVLNQEFAVILLDVNMPGMDGFETASLIRQRRSSADTPIIFITSFGDEMHAARGYSLGAVDYILAPVIPEVLRTKVAVFVDLFRKTQQLQRQTQWLRQRASQMQKLAAASVAINSALSMERMLQTITDAARDVIGSHQAITWFLPPAGAGTRPGQSVAVGSFSDRYADWIDRPLHLDALTGAIVARSRSATRLTEEELHEHPDWELVRTLDVPPIHGGMLAAPLVGRDGDHFGVIFLAERTVGQFTTDDEAILVQLAQMASIAIDNTLFSQEREANRAKDEFLATLSHELRTPLSAMLGWTQLLRSDDDLGEEVAHGLEVIERNVRAQAKLVEDLLDVSRITSGKLHLNLRPLSPVTVMEAAIDAIRPTAEAKQILIHATLSPTPMVMADADRLQQAVCNLLTNAVKFTDPGGRVQITLDVEADETASWPRDARIGADGRVDGSHGGGSADGSLTGQSCGQRVRIRISDNGHGIHPRFLPHVFDRFRQADSSSTRSHGGLGIGLTIVRHIIEALGGSVAAHSAGEGHGATFTIYLPAHNVPDGPGDGPGETADEREKLARSGDHKVPRAERRRGGRSRSTALASALPELPDPALADRPMEPAAVHEPTVQNRRLDGLQVLLVEDEPDTRNFLCRSLGRAGAHVHAAASVSAARDLLSRARPDIIVSDIAMPGADGYDLIRYVRSLTPEQGGLIPAIALTAYARAEDRTRALAAGFQEHLAKPVQPNVLNVLVSDLCQAPLPRAHTG